MTSCIKFHSMAPVRKYKTLFTGPIRKRKRCSIKFMRGLNKLYQIYPWIGEEHVLRLCTFDIGKKLIGTSR